IADQALAVAQEERRVVLARVDAGDLAPVERSRVEASVVQARSSQLEAHNTAISAAEALQILAGAEPDGQVTAVTVPAEPVNVTLDADAMGVEALANNPDLQSQRVAEEGADLDLRDARHGRLPSLAAVGNYTLRGYETSLGAALDEMSTGTLRDWYVGGELSAPLGNRSDRGSVLQKQAALASARITRQALERTIEQSVRSQVRNVEQDRLKLDLARANLDLAQQTLAAERALEDAGRAIQKDVLEAIRSVDDAKVSVEQARADHALAVVELMRLRGAL
ncbi:MAG: TolC family protein, partial [Oligoflexia bacterium]|nr:TolC family protein [Oligoflexia bacterium]